MSKTEVTFVKVNALSSYSIPRSSAAYSNIKSTALLDYDSKNRYFYDGDPITFADIAALTAGKNFTDSVGTVSDLLQSIESGKGVVDDFAIGDFVYVLLILQRQFTESVGFSDTSTLSAHKVLSDIITMDDFASVGDRTIDTIGSKSNAFSFADTQSVATGKSLFESPVVTEVYSSVFAKSRADTLSVAESISVSNRSLIPSILNARAINTATLNN